MNMAPNDIDRLRQGFSAVRISDHIEATPPTPTTPTSRMHLLSGLRTAPKEQAVPKTRGYTNPNVNGVPNGYDYGMASPSPRIVLSPNDHADGLNYTSQRQSRGHKHQHSRGSSVSSLQAPRTPFGDIRPDTPESVPETFDPQVYASLQQQYLELLATNQYLVQQAQQQQLALQQQYLAQQQFQQLAFLSPPRTPISGYTPQYVYDSPTSQGFLSPGPERHQFASPRRSRFEQTTADNDLSPPSEVPFRIPSPATSPSPASSESSWRRGHRRGKSSISINSNAPKQLQPIRQPIGPPPMETLLAKKAMGDRSPNFASRLRRKAVNRLMQAGLERKNTSSSPTVGVPQFEFQDAQGKVESESVVEAGPDGESDGRRRNIRRSALF